MAVTATHSKVKAYRLSSWLFSLTMEIYGNLPSAHHWSTRVYHFLWVFMFHGGIPRSHHHGCQPSWPPSSLRRGAFFRSRIAKFRFLSCAANVGCPGPQIAVFAGPSSPIQGYNLGSCWISLQDLADASDRQKRCQKRLHLICWRASSHLGLASRGPLKEMSQRAARSETLGEVLW